MATAKMNILRTNNLSDLLFDVEKVETKLITGMDANSDYSHSIIAHTPQGKKHVNFCSDRYELVPVSDFAPAIRQIILNTGLEFTENYHMINDAVMYGEMTIKDKRFYVGQPNDELNMRLFWSHSYNGLEQYELNLGTFTRVLCSNGLWISKYDTEKYGLAISGKHTVKIRESLETLQNKLQFVLDNDVMQKASEIYRPLYDNFLNNWEDRLIDIMKVAGIGETKNNVETIKSTINKEAGILYDGNVNDWLIYNGINHFLTNNVNALESTKRAKDQKVLAELLN